MPTLAKNDHNASPFDQIRKTDENNYEYWSAKEVLTLLGYKSWKRQLDTIERAKIACTNAGILDTDHFVECWEMVQIGGNPKTLRKVLKDYKLTAQGVDFVKKNLCLKKTTAKRAETTERQYQERLCERLKGIMEVSTPVGKIDILTTSEIIEVKEVKKWKYALGQIIAYGHYYPNHNKRIHLFGVTSLPYLKEVIAICDSIGVIISTEV